MKKIVSLVLVLTICLSLCACGKSDGCTCDCPQCALCEQKTHAHEAEEITQEPSVTVTEQEDTENRIVFPEPLLLAEDEKVRIELISFFEEYSPYKDIGKYVELTFTNKADYEIGVMLKNLAAGGSSVDASYPAAQIPALYSGETTTYFIEIRDHFNHALESVDLLHTLKGHFKIMRRKDDSVYTDTYELPFSVEDALDNNSVDSIASSLEDSSYLGKWQVTYITFADENISSHMKEDAALWENYFKGVLSAFDNVYFVFTESGDCYYHTENGTKTGKWKETENGMQAGGTVFVAEGSKLVAEQDGYLLYWEKVSDSQTVPET